MPLCRHCRASAEVTTRSGPKELSPSDFDRISGVCDRCGYLGDRDAK